MHRVGLAALVALLVAAPRAGVCGEARVTDVRVGQHGNNERIVVELKAQQEVGVRWTGDESGAEIFAIAARPMLARQLLSSGRPHVGEMLLLAAQDGAELRLEPQARRTRAFLLSDPPRLVIDIAAPGKAAFDPPADVHAIRRESAEPPPEEAAPAAAPAAEEPLSQAPLDQAAEPAAEAASVAEPETELEEAAAPEPPASATPSPLPVPLPATQPSWLQSRALVAPLLTGVGVLILAAGGLALASAQRPRASRSKAIELPEAAALSADRLDLLEKRLDEEARARAQLTEQVAEVRQELGSLRDVFLRLRAQAAARSAAPIAPQ